MGMIVGRLQPPFRRQTVGSQWVIWRYVTTQAEHAADPRYVLVQGCPDFVFATNRTRIEKTEPGFQFSCFCKTAAWFERAVALSEGRNLLARVLFAEHYARLVFDRELHDEQLRQVLDAEPDVPDLTLQNTYAKEQAQQLLDGADDYF